jgi:hypothetical protein
MSAGEREEGCLNAATVGNAPLARSDFLRRQYRVELGVPRPFVRKRESICECFAKLQASFELFFIKPVLFCDAAMTAR